MAIQLIAPGYRKTRPLSPNTEREYQRVLTRAFGRDRPSYQAVPPPARALGNVTPLRFKQELVPYDFDILPDWEGDGSGGINTGPWSESERQMLSSAVKDYFFRRGEAEAGLQLAARIPHHYQVERVVPHPTLEQVDIFEKQIARVKPPHRYLLRILLGIGLRAEELLSLTREQVLRARDEGELLIIRKGGFEQVLPARHLKAEMAALLNTKARLPHATQAAFRREGKAALPPVREWERLGEVLTAGNPRVQYNVLIKTVKNTAKQAGLDPKLWRPHQLRHAFATRMHADGAPIRVIQVALGHSQITTTQRYINVEAGDIENHLRAPVKGASRGRARAEEE